MNKCEREAQVCGQCVNEIENDATARGIKTGAEAERKKIIKMFQSEELELFLKGKKQSLSMWEINEMLESED